MVAAVGWALIVAPTPSQWGRGAASTAEDGKRRLLRQTIVNQLKALQPLPLWDTAGLLAIDDRLRRGMAQGPAEAVESALRLGVRRFVVEGCEYRLDGELACEAELRLRVRVGAAVVAIVAAGETDTNGFAGGGSATVHFRRYRPPLEVSHRAASVLEAVRMCEETTVQSVVRRTHGMDELETVRLLRRLESDRVLELTIDDETCRRLLSDAATRFVAIDGGRR
jgi:hypothetical protein